MKCADCKWWTRNTPPAWAQRNPKRWAQIQAEEPEYLNTGECGRLYNEGYHTSLMSIECNYALYTRDIFGCVQFEAKDAA